MENIIIDEGFRSILPALDRETFEALEENLKTNGCRDALVTWNGILIDGHNRYRICMEHGIPFQTIEKEFPSREDALIWIISNQVSRRNLLPIQLSYYRGLHYMADKKKVGNTKGKNQHKVELPDNQAIPHHEAEAEIGATATRLSKKYKVSRDTIERDARVAEAIDAIGERSPEAKRKILSGEVKLDKKELKGFSYRSHDEIGAAALEIEGGTYIKKAPEKPAAESREPGDAIDTLPGSTMDRTIGDLADIFCASLRELSMKGDIAKLRAAFEAYINALEALHGNV